MGICSSCLGDRKKADENERLLSQNDGYNAYGYNSFANGNPVAREIDPTNVVREREALERIVQRATDNLIDIFALQQTTNGSTMVTTAYAGDDARAEIYRELLSKTSPPEMPEMPMTLPQDSINSDERKWLDELSARADEAVLQMTHLKSVGTLVVGLDFIDS